MDEEEGRGGWLGCRKADILFAIIMYAIMYARSSLGHQPTRNQSS